MKAETTFTLNWVNKYPRNLAQNVTQRLFAQFKA